MLACAVQAVSTADVVAHQFMHCQCDAAAHQCSWSLDFSRSRTRSALVHASLLLAAGVVLSRLKHDAGYLSLHNAYMCSGQQLLSLARRCLHEAAVCNNVSPSNILLVPMQPSAAGSRRVAASSGCGTASETAAAAMEHGQLVLLDLGSDWVPPDPYTLMR